LCANKVSLGKVAEDRARRFLETAGYRIVCRNYRTRYAEIDIIALDRGVICFVEVRSKNTPAFGDAAESVDRKKRGRISRAAVHYLKEKNLFEQKARFDVVCIQQSASQLIQNAFELEGDF
jgi:putative endonuclease